MVSPSVLLFPPSIILKEWLQTKLFEDEVKKYNSNELNEQKKVNEK